MSLQDHIDLGRPAWSWHANAAADSLAGEAAVAFAPYGKDKANAFILGRAWRLNKWLLPRVQFWLRQQSTCKLPKQSESRRTKDAFLLSLRNNPVGGHEWESSVKGLCCLRCGTKLPKYKSLSDLEVLVQIPCDGMSGVRGVHCTHTMYGGTRKTCNVCKGVCYAGRQISKKLRQPCGTSGRVLYIQTEIVWAGSLLGENKYHSPAKVYSCQKSVCVFRHSCSCCCAVGCIPLEACLIDLSALTIE